MKFGTVVMPLKVTLTFLIPYLQPFQNGGRSNMRWMQNLHQSMWDHEILCADRFSKDEQLLMRPFLSETKKYKHGGRLNVKIHSLFSGDNS
jgi:hypothetical protein